MALPLRNLTIRFNQTVLGDGIPDTVEVAVVPLSTPSNPNLGTFVGGTQKKEVVLVTDPTNVVFQLVPSDDPSLTERVIYRVGWRSKYQGREFHYDIVMPDQDIRFDQLTDLGAVLGGETYLKNTDRGRLGGVAAIDDQGRVLDGEGHPVLGNEAAQSVQNNLDNEIVNRQHADQVNFNNLSSQIVTQVNQVTTTTAGNLALAVGTLQDADAHEAVVRSDAVDDLNTALDGLTTFVNAQITALNSTLTTQAAALLTKADLSGGKVAVSEIPDIAIGRAVLAADQAAMLALLSSAVQQGDFAVRPDGAWQLQASNPGILGNWVRVVAVGSVNGQTGVVTLTAADVGARSSSVSIAQSDITGLSASLTAKADTSVTNGLNSRVTNIENDTTIVHTSGGFINHTLNDSSMAYISGSSVTKKDGTVIVTSGGGVIESVNGQTGIVVLNAASVGARDASTPIAQADVTNLVSDLAGKASSSDSRLTDSRMPLGHGSTHGVSGTDPVTIAQSQVTGLPTILSNNNLGNTSNHGNRIAALETLGVGGGGSVDPMATRFYGTGSFPGVTTISDFQTDGVLLKGPFGRAVSDSTYYYTSTGAADGEERWPYITPNGHLQLRKWDETAPADSPPATQADISTVNTAIGLKADTTTVTALTSTVATKADLTAFNNLTTTVANKADQSSLDTTNAAVALKASAASVTALTTTVAGKADSSVTTGLNTRLTTVETTLPTKADLSGGVLSSSQIPSVPQANVTGLVSALAAKADLSGGKVLLSQIPTGIPTASISGLDTTLSTKADLVGGKVATSQMPALATHETFAVANRAAMLALTTTQVQVGDTCIITATTDQGTYTLISSDPSQFTNWLLNQPPANSVASVNSQTGIVVLSYSDVGARGSTIPIPQSDITGLVAALSSKADGTATTSALAGKTSPADVQAILTASPTVKQVVGYVATSPVASRSGQQSVDGITVPLASVVLLTAESSSINNGLWVVNSGAWTRTGDFATGAYLVKDTICIVANGIANANTIWQETANSGIVDTNANNWSKIGNCAPQYAPVAGNGILLTGSTFSVKNTTGIAVSGAGVGIDTSIVPRKYAQDVPAGSNVVTITHNLGTNDVVTFLRDKASGDQTLICPTVTGVNTVSLEFNTAPSSGQWRIVILG